MKERSKSIYSNENEKGNGQHDMEEREKKKIIGQMFTL